MNDSGFPEIVSLEIKNPFNIKTFKHDKESILDIKAVDERGRIFNIEVQTSGDNIFRNRTLYYWARLYSSQLEEGNFYSQLYPVVCINILEFNLFAQFNKDHSTFMVHEHSNPELVLSEHLRIHFLELPKLKNLNLTRRLAHWLYFFKKEGMEDKNMEVLLKENDNIAEAHAAYEAFSRDEKLVDAYEARMKWYRDYVLGLEYAKEQARKQALEEGREEGRELGREEGREEGLKKGRQQGQIEIARKMLAEGFNPEIIGKFVNLSMEEIKNLGF